MLRECSKWFAIVAVCLILSVFSATAQAATIVGAISATATSEFGGDFDIGNTIDQSGLSIGFTSGVTDFDTYIGLNPIHTFVAIDNEWFTALNVLAATIVYDLGAIFSIDRIAIWNDEFSGVGMVDVFVSTDNVLYTNAVNGLMPTNHDPDTDYPADVFGLGGVQSARYVRLEVSGCPQEPLSQGPYCGLGEVAFSAVPEPNTFALATLGLVGFGLRGRRTRRS